MDRNKLLYKIWRACEPLLFALLIYACANRGYPQGGAKDETPPEIVVEEPLSFSKNFNEKKINIYFNEFVQLKDMSEKFVFSPPLKKNPRVSLRGKYIQISIADTLRPNTTYSLDFGDAIVDNNEGNPLGFYRYVFSTGDYIDTLELSGQIVHAESYEPMLGVLVALYENLADSVPLLELPNYIARSDSSGNFRFTNIKDTVYRVAALVDMNKDKKYTPESEMFAFIDTTVHPIVFPAVKIDTFRLIEQIVNQDTLFRDSIVSTDYLAYGPSNLFLRVFQEKLTQLYLVDDSRPERERLNFVFSLPGENQFEVRLWDSLATEPFPEDWYFKESNVTHDTISLWIKDSTVYKKDTLNMILTYLRSDSTGQRFLVSDTVRYTFKEKKKNDKEKEKEKEAKIEFLDLLSNVTENMDLGVPVFFEFKRPVDQSGLEKIRVLEKVDSTYQLIPSDIQQDSLNLKKFYVKVPWQAGKKYKMEIDSATIYDLYGMFNNKYEKAFKFKTEENYGKIMLDVKGVTGTVLVQMYKSEEGKSENGVRVYKILQEKKITQNGQCLFELVPEGKYKFRAILDSNGNGIWDTGLYLKHQQPEKMVYLPVEIVVKQNFDYEQSFDLDEFIK